MLHKNEAHLKHNAMVI